MVSLLHSSKPSSVILEACYQHTPSPANPYSCLEQTISAACSLPPSTQIAAFPCSPFQPSRKSISILKAYASHVTPRGQQRGPDLGILAEIASCQLEYTYLAKETGNHYYYSLVRSRQIPTLLSMNQHGSRQTMSSGNSTKLTSPTSGVCFCLFDGVPKLHNHSIVSEFCFLALNSKLQHLLAHLSVGAQADSAHEYLLKQYLLTAKTRQSKPQKCVRHPFIYLSPSFLSAYTTPSPDIRTTTHILTNLFYLSPTRHFLYA